MRRQGRDVLIALVLIILSFLFRNNEKINPDIFLILSALISGLPILKSALAALRFKIVSIDALVSIAFVGALIIGEYWEAAAVTFLFNFGGYLESLTINKTRKSIESLLDSNPLEARTLRAGVEAIISIDDVELGDIILVKSGEQIPVDGRVIEGNAFVNEAAITGESIARDVLVEDGVYSGSIIESGYLLIETEKVGNDTTFSKIIEIVEEAQDKKALTQKKLDKFSRIYTPSIIIFSILLYIFKRDIYLSLTLLVIACPGALVISTPVAIVAGIGKAAQNGILFKGGETIESFDDIKILAFDKTGTLTSGIPVVTGFNSFDMDEKEFLELVAIGEKYSEHPLARGIIDYAELYLQREITDTPSESEIIPGRGIRTLIKGKTYFIGNKRLMDEENIIIDEDQEEYIEIEKSRGQTVIFVGSKDLIGSISMADEVREESREMINNIKALGIKKLVMLTGDNKEVANNIGISLGIDKVYSELLPNQKVEVLESLREEYGSVAMIGDGINDAPALAVADMGIAMGGIGSDIAVETADVILMLDRLDKIPYAFSISNKTNKIIRQNIVFSIFIAFLLIMGVIGKVIFLSSGMFIHEMSVILVIINAMRLLL